MDIESTDQVEQPFMSPQDIKQFTRIYTEFIAESVTHRNWDNRRQSYTESLRFGRNLRDNWMHTYPILPGAVLTFNDVATSRNWLVIGRPATASRTVNRLSNAFMVDRYGIYHKGFEQLFSRMCYDWLTIGRAMLHSHPLEGSARDWSAYEYIDPGYTTPVTINGEIMWQYRPMGGSASRVIPQNELFFMDNLRIGHSGAVMGRVAYLIPMANLAWLMLQHDTLQLDGRKIREIFLVKKGMGKALQDALVMFMALASGEDPSKLQIPIMEIDSMDETPINDMIGRIGLSEVPREFTRSDLEGLYVREIASTLGLPIGQFWYDPRGTNRSLEQVQQERATLKGPAYYVRSFCKMVNGTPMMGTTPGDRAMLTFEEETDSSSLDLQSKALKTYAETVAILDTQFPEMILPADWMEFFYRQKLIPPSSLLPGFGTYEENDLKRALPEYTTLENLTERLLNKMSIPQRSAIMDGGVDLLERGQVRMDMDGYIREYRPDFQIGWTNQHAI